MCVGVRSPPWYNDKYICIFLVHLIVAFLYSSLVQIFNFDIGVSKNLGVDLKKTACKSDKYV